MEVCGAVEEVLTNVFFPFLQSLSLLPEEAIVGLITYGKMVHVHEVRPTYLWSVYDLLVSVTFWLLGRHVLDLS